MKKIFTLATAVLMTMVVMAADRRPAVTLNGGKGYEVLIDGKTISAKQFGAMNLSYLRNGKHTIAVYEIPRRFFAVRSKREIAAASFIIKNNDISIRIDQNGKINVKEETKKQFDNRGWDDHDNGYGKDQGKGYGKDRKDKPGRF